MPHGKYQNCIDACNDCTVACEHCATECLHEQDVKMTARCIELDRASATICATAAPPDGKRFGFRGTCLRRLRRNLPSLRRRMREARGTTLSGLRASMSSVRRGMPQNGSLGTRMMRERQSSSSVFLVLATVRTSTAEHGCLFRNHSHSASFRQECESPLY